MILLTGATGNVGSALLRRLTSTDRPVRAFVRNPRRLGHERIRVQIALGNLSDPSSFRHALRGVDTVVHLAAAIRDQPGGSIEELNGVATLRLVRAAERAGVKRFIFFSALGTSLHSPARFFRAKEQAERAVQESGLDSVVLKPSIIYAPGDPWLTLLDAMSLLPLVPVSGRGRAAYQPIWAGDVAAAVMNVLDHHDGQRRLYELAGPETLTYDQIVQTFLRAKRRRRRLLHVPLPLVKAGLRGLEFIEGSAAFATWDEAELMEIPMIAERGTADAELLGVNPLPMEKVLSA
jgi:NADH dehydrogenase